MMETSTGRSWNAHLQMAVEAKSRSEPRRTQKSRTHMQIISRLEA